MSCTNQFCPLFSNNFALRSRKYLHLKGLNSLARIEQEQDEQDEEDEAEEDEAEEVEAKEVKKEEDKAEEVEKNIVDKRQCCRKNVSRSSTSCSSKHTELRRSLKEHEWNAITDETFE